MPKRFSDIDIRVPIWVSRQLTCSLDNLIRIHLSIRECEMRVIKLNLNRVTCSRSQIGRKTEIASYWESACFGLPRIERANGKCISRGVKPVQTLIEDCPHTRLS